MQWTTKTLQSAEGFMWKAIPCSPVPIEKHREQPSPSGNPEESAPGEEMEVLNSLYSTVF